MYMTRESELLTFGPVPSRRLGRSLGINHIPPKACTYACVYCQVGRTTEMHGVRRAFFEPAKVCEAAVSRLNNATSAGEAVNYISFVPDGEPTIDIHLGQEIELLKPLGVKIAVISNASLIWREDVRNDLKKADWVSLKVDACREETWRKINRPHGILNLKAILDGMLTFAGEFDGTLVTETMLVKGLNDDDKVIVGIADFLARLRPSKAYLSVPIRPPVETGVTAPDEKIIIGAYQTIRESVPEAELLIEYEGDEFTSTGQAETDLLSITSVHPMREEAVGKLLANAGLGRDVVDRLVKGNKLRRIRYKGETYYIRRLVKDNRNHQPFS